MNGRWVLCAALVLAMAGTAWADDVKLSVDDARKAALEGVQTHRDLSAYAVKDPQFDAHMATLRNDPASTEVFEGPFVDSYVVNHETEQLYYFEDDGSLDSVMLLTPRGAYPASSFDYVYPSGDLDRVEYSPDASHSYVFGPDGTFRQKTENGHCTLADGGSCD